MVIDNSNVDLYNDDCFKVISKLKDNSISLIVTDPPYAIGFANTHSKEDNKWDKKSSEEYIDFTNKWLNAVYPKLTENGQIWFFFAPTMIREIITVLDNSQYIPHWENWSIMARSKGRGSGKKLKSLREDYIHLTKSKTYQWNAVEYLRRVVAPYREKGGAKRGWDYGNDGVTPVRFTGMANIVAFCNEHPVFVTEKERHRGAVLDIASGERLYYDGEPSDVTFFSMPSVNNIFERQQHSAQKPVLLLTMLIMLCSEKGDTILDPFGGSFSSGVAAILSDRNYIGIEQEKESFKKAKNWLENINYTQANQYIKEHVSSSEKGFKFGLDTRKILPKKLK